MTIKRDHIYEKITTLINREKKEAVNNFRGENFESAIYQKIRDQSGEKAKTPSLWLNPVFVTVVLLLAVAISIFLTTNSGDKTSNQLLLKNTKKILLSVPAFTISLKSMRENDTLPEPGENEEFSRNLGISFEKNLNFDERIRRLGKLFIQMEKKKSPNGEKEG